MLPVLGRLWQRYVARDPDYYRAYVNLPVSSASAVDIGEARALIDDLERACEGRLDVRATSEALIAVTDDVPAETFDAAAVDRLLDRLEAWYEPSHDVARYRTWRRRGRDRDRDRSLVRSIVVVPVRPLFPPADEGRETAATVAESR